MELNRKAQLELNAKIAEWVVLSDGCAPWVKSRADNLLDIPDFTTSLDACFDYIVPKLNKMGWFVNLMQASMSAYWKCQLWSPWDGTAPNITLETLRDRPVERAENPALALCLAVEKLIDGV